MPNANLPFRSWILAIGGRVGDDKKNDDGHAAGLHCSEGHRPKSHWEGAFFASVLSPCWGQMLSESHRTSVNLVIVRGALEGRKRKRKTLAFSGSFFLYQGLVNFKDKVRTEKNAFRLHRF